MKTVKEISQITGISVRTLHYYDEIGLFSPTEHTEAGYRLYDDKALEKLQQILFFREFDMPLKEIKSIMDNSALDRNQILKGQRRMLESKKVRLERLISSIDDILRGDNQMDFQVFSKDEMETVFQKMMLNMTDEMKAVLIKEYGDLDKFYEDFMRTAASEEAQKNYEKMIEWYGDRESLLDSVNHAPGMEGLEAYQKRIDRIMKQLAEKQGEDVSSFEVKALIGEYGFVVKQLYHLPDERVFMIQTANDYREHDKIGPALDEQYGVGTAAFFAAAVNAFYK